MLTGGQQMSFTCRPCSQEFLRYTQQQLEYAPQGLSQQEQMAALRTLRDEAETHISSLCDLNDADSRKDLVDDSKVMAIYTIVHDLAEKAGVDPDRFLKHYEIRFRWWHDYYLRQAEDVSPALAAELDSRSLEQAAVSQNYPSIFDEPQ